MNPDNPDPEGKLAKMIRYFVHGCRQPFVQLIRFMKTSKMFSRSMKVVKPQCYQIVTFALTIATCRILVKHVFTLPNWLGLLSSLALLYRILSYPSPVIYGLTNNFVLWIQIFCNGVGFFLGVLMFILVNYLYNNNLFFDEDSTTIFKNIQTICRKDAPFVTLYAFYYPIDIMFLSAFNGLKLLTVLSTRYVKYNWKFICRWSKLKFCSTTSSITNSANGRQNKCNNNGSVNQEGRIEEIDSK